MTAIVGVVICQQWIMMPRREVILIKRVAATMTMAIVIVVAKEIVVMMWRYKQVEQQVTQADPTAWAIVRDGMMKINRCVQISPLRKNVIPIPVHK